MKYKILILLSFFSVALRAQTICRTDIMNNEELIPANRIEQFITYNFSNLWLKTDNDLIYGIIGDEHQRILIKILKVTQHPDHPEEYLIKGKSSVKGNVCDFNGKITIQEIRESKRTHFGVDNEFKDKGINTQGLLTAKYEFLEDKSQKHPGTFYGILKTKWYLDKNDKMVYDDINIASDGYFNNAFVGKWKSYQSKAGKRCNWADYRVPDSNCDFDIGTGEFNVSEKYFKNGWFGIALKNKMPNGAIIESKDARAQKSWWQ
ncbi:hypothetical protein [Pedobacter caeni]|uniref:MORN repeat variant n=1 Tax=Pedobacter caeni TaxID=288992 RepID=A0A1M4VJM6_9SPHI|nr:hypothetical protein [Pedobacter caeni]SHE69073.1 hypothetical protein SAMN04488522_101927 [Pedobacter caeni]